MMLRSLRRRYADKLQDALHGPRTHELNMVAETVLPFGQNGFQPELPYGKVENFCGGQGAKDGHFQGRENSAGALEPEVKHLRRVREVYRLYLT